MSNNRNDARDLYDNAKAHAENTANEAKSRVKDGLDHAKEFAAESRDYIHEKRNEAGEYINEFGERIREGFDRVRHMDKSDLEESWEGVKDRVRENPGVALAIAAGAGLVLGLICSLKNNNYRR